MGLDMYAFRTKAVIESDVDFDPPETDGSKVIATWRKHPNLHGWMEILYREKGGKKESFNVTPVKLTAADIDRLEGDVHNLPTKTGFFFGASSSNDTQDDLNFISAAREAFADGDTVFYLPWW
jgi:hypothetical protein